ncbi:hypothetical protein GCM10009415_22220 [Chitinophaga japonensis]
MDIQPYNGDKMLITHQHGFRLIWVTRFNVVPWRYGGKTGRVFKDNKRATITYMIVALSKILPFSLGY